VSRELESRFSFRDNSCWDGSPALLKTWLFSMLIIVQVVRINPDKGSEFATQLANNEGGSLVDVERVVDVFQSQGMVQAATAFLLDALKEDRPDQGHLQTRLLEMNLMNAPQVADAILGNEMFHHYDRPRIAQLCEQAGLSQRALEHYDDPESVKRVIVNIVANPTFSQDWLNTFFGKLSLDQSFDCLDAMLKTNIRQNLGAVVQIATKYSDLLGATRLIDLFEKYKTAEGLFYYLGSIVNLSEDQDVNFKYIEAATKMGQFQEVERICRDSSKLHFLFALISLSFSSGICYHALNPRGKAGHLLYDEKAYRQGCCGAESFKSSS